MTERRKTSWAVRKEINLANMFTTVGAIIGGVWWAAGVNAKFDLMEQDNAHIREAIIANTAMISATKIQYKSIDDKLDALQLELKYFQGKNEGEHSDLKASSH
jgi:hypothetical protein